MERPKGAGRFELAVVTFGDDAASDALRAVLERQGHRVVVVDGAAWLEQPLPRETLLVLPDAHSFPRDRMLAALSAPGAPPALIAFTDGSVTSDEPLFAAAVDCLGLPCHPAELAFRLERLRAARAGRVPDLAEVDVLQECLPFQMLGNSPALQRAVAVLRKFARCDAPVLIEGETGTGKELAARAIHYMGARRDHPFVALNCGAIPEHLLENELFGHERGAYTDARERQPGLVEQAQGGTLFFDEVDALGPKGQVCVLRFLQEREYRPLGARGARKSDARILAATNVALATLVEDRRFRADLVYRLRVLDLALPPLRERREDIALLADHFLRQLAARYGQGRKRLTEPSLAWMQAQPWAGNVRELENLLHRQYLLADGKSIDLTSSQEPPAPAGDKAEPAFAEAKAKFVAAFERTYLERLIVDAGGNISLAARRAGKDRSALRRLLHKHGLNVSHAD